MEKAALLGRQVTVKLKDETTACLVVGDIEDGMANLISQEGLMVWRTEVNDLEQGSDENASYHLGEIVFNQD